MDLFNEDILEKFKIDFHNDKKKSLDKINKSELQQKLQPLIVTLLGATQALSVIELKKLIDKGIGFDNLPESIRESIQKVNEDNDNFKKIYDVLKKFNTNFNRIYVFSPEKGIAYLERNEEPEWNNFIPTYFDVIKEGYSGYPYYSPKGWRRYSLKIDDFDKYTNWPIAYHGTKTENLIDILIEGFRISKGKGRAVFGEGVYFSPSIEYCGHWRYGTPKKSKKKNLYIQAVFQCKLRPGSFSVQRETMILDDKKQKKSQDPKIDETKIIDPNYSNKELEWVIKSETIEKLRKEGEEAYIIYGIMARITKEHPKDLPINKWWDYYFDMD